MLTGDRPYTAAIMKMEGFEVHKHPELEINYCTMGEYDIIIDKKRYTLKKGDVAVIGVMTAHEIPCGNKNDHLSLVIEMGPLFLSGYFDLLSGVKLDDPIIRAESSPLLGKLFAETAVLCNEKPEFYELSVKGDLYLICAELLKAFSSVDRSAHVSKAILSVANVEKALETIRTRYSEPLAVSEMAALCGYSKSNFCKIFKRATGQSFHAALNQHRLNVSRYMLKETAQSVEGIAVSVGFSDAKSFCRVFKNEYGITPNTYRNNG